MYSGAESDYFASGTGLVVEMIKRSLADGAFWALFLDEGEGYDEKIHSRACCS